MSNKDIKMFFATHEHVSLVGPVFDVYNFLYMRVVMRMLIVIYYVALLVAFYFQSTHLVCLLVCIHISLKET